MFKNRYIYKVYGRAKEKSISAVISILVPKLITTLYKYDQDLPVVLFFFFFVFLVLHPQQARSELHL